MAAARFAGGGRAKSMPTSSMGQFSNILVTAPSADSQLSGTRPEGAGDAQRSVASPQVLAPGNVQEEQDLEIRCSATSVHVGEAPAILEQDPADLSDDDSDSSRSSSETYKMALQASTNTRSSIHSLNHGTRGVVSRFSKVSNENTEYAAHTQYASTGEKSSRIRKMLARTTHCLFSWMDLEFADKQFEDTYLHHCDCRNAKLFRSRIWPILTLFLIVAVLYYAVQCPLRCHDVCGADDKAMLQSNGRFVGKGSLQCAEREGVLYISAILSAFVFLQLWLLCVRLRLVGFERCFNVVSIPFSLLPYFFSVYRVCTLFGVDPKRYGWFGAESDDAIPLLINLGILCLGTAYFKLRTRFIWWLAPFQVCIYFVWNVVLGLGIHDGRNITIIICGIYSSLCALMLKARINTEVWERNAWNAVRHHRHLLHQLEEKNDLLAAREELHILSNEYNAQARGISSLHVQFYILFLAASHSDAVDTANMIWSTAKEKFSEIQTQVTKLAALDTKMLRAVLKEHEADRAAWSYIQRMDEAWVAEHVEKRKFHGRESVQGSKKVQSRQQVPRNVLAEDGQFVKLKKQKNETWQLTNTESLRFGLINATWFRSVIFNEMHHLVDTLNHAESVSDIHCQFPSIAVDRFPGELRDPDYVLLPDPKAEVNGPIVNMKYGPMKTMDSSLRKAAEYRAEHEEAGGVWETPDSRYILDQLRLTISVANPMVAAIFVEALFDIRFFRVIRLKNKYLGSHEDVIKTGSPSILIQVEARHEVMPPLIFEIQVYVDAFLSLKHSQHNTYEFSRAGAADLLYPIVYDKKNHHLIIQETTKKANMEEIQLPNSSSSMASVSSDWALHAFNNCKRSSVSSSKSARRASSRSSSRGSVHSRISQRASDFFRGASASSQRVSDMGSSASEVWSGDRSSTVKGTSQSLPASTAPTPRGSTACASSGERNSNPSSRDRNSNPSSGDCNSNPFFSLGAFYNAFNRHSDGCRPNVARQEGPAASSWDIAQWTQNRSAGDK